eukprot:TRINITY_DN7770_c0_g5_i1.p1 TRINITY_DN7770_c0_g5~~TRINITY_DN7770_c0_g5_i1.p1  ORF type:complete len:561 (+),score=113.86 TRINITY_DN7770_c0_g5_i1:186-1685(+)
MGGDHLVRCVDSFVEEEKLPPRFRYFIVMECYDCSLAEFVRKRKGPLSREAVTLLLIHISRALQDLHDRNKAHRDVKPLNIFCKLAPNGEVAAFYLGDLGTAKEVINPETMSFKGTMMYMPPEQLNKQPYGLPVDLYSLGVTAVEVGVSPEGVHDLVAAIQGGFSHPHVLEEARPFLKNRLGSDITSIVLGLLAEHPDERPTAERLHRNLMSIVKKGSMGALVSELSPQAEITRLNDVIVRKDKALKEAAAKEKEAQDLISSVLRRHDAVEKQLRKREQELKALRQKAGLSAITTDKEPAPPAPPPPAPALPEKPADSIDDLEMELGKLSLLVKQQPANDGGNPLILTEAEHTQAGTAGKQPTTAVSPKILPKPTFCTECTGGWDAFAKYGCDVTEEYESKNGTPLHVAAWRGKQDLLKHLCERHDVSEWINKGNKHGNTPLHHAAHFGHCDMVPILLAAGAGIDTTNLKGERPIDVVCRGSNANNKQNLIDLLLKCTP